MSLIYGIVKNNIFFSTRLERKTPSVVQDGVYSLDMNCDDFWNSLSPANINDARKYFTKTNNMTVIRGVGFHDCFIPENPVKFTNLPIKVTDPTYDEFDMIDVVDVKGKFMYFLQIVNTDKSYVLMDVRQNLDEKVVKDISTIKGVSPDIRILHSFHMIEKIKKEQLEPTVRIKEIMTKAGANVSKVVQKNTGYEVFWSIGNTKINTWLNKDFRVVEAGFCTSGNDKTQSANSLPNLLSEYKKDKSYFSITRSVD